MYIMSWLGCLLLFILMASYTADEPTNWEFACGKHFKLQYHHIQDSFMPFSGWIASSAKHNVQISSKDTDLVLSQFYVFTPTCYKFGEREQSSNSCSDLKINHTNEWSIKIINKKQMFESKLRFNIYMGYYASSNMDYYVQIGDNFSDNFYNLCKLSFIEPKRVTEKGDTFDWHFEIPLMSTTINVTHRDMFTGQRTDVDGLFNNGGIFHFHIEVDFDNGLLDNLYCNERISKIRDNVINAINWGQDVPVSKKNNDVTLHWKTEKLNIFTNITFADFETRDVEKWYLLKAESKQWPHINIESNSLLMTLNKTNWGVGFGKSHWNQVSWTYRDGNNIALSTHFNSDFPISSAVLKLDFINSTLNIVLNFLESKWNLELRKTERPQRGHLAIITRTDLWTQQRRPYTVLKINDVDLEFPESNEQSSKLVISSLQNFKSTFKNMRGSFKKVNDLMHSLIENRLLPKLLDLISTVLLDGKLDEDLLKKVDHLESLIKKAVTFVGKTLQDFVEDANIDIKELFVRSLRSMGGEYVEKSDKIIVKYSDSLIKALPLYIYKELLTVQCVNTR